MAAGFQTAQTERTVLRYDRHSGKTNGSTSGLFAPRARVRNTPAHPPIHPAPLTASRANASGARGRENTYPWAMSHLSALRYES